GIGGGHRARVDCLDGDLRAVARRNTERTGGGAGEEGDDADADRLLLRVGLRLPEGAGGCCERTGDGDGRHCGQAYEAGGTAGKGTHRVLHSWTGKGNDSNRVVLAIPVGKGMADMVP